MIFSADAVHNRGGFVMLPLKLMPPAVVLDGGRLVADCATADLLEDQSFLKQHGLA